MDNNPRYRSEQINEIAAALAKAQGAYAPLAPNENGAYGRYANLDAIMQATRPALAANGLSFHQYIDLIDNDGAALLKTSLMHSSGQYIASCERILKPAVWRAYGNQLEFLKRQQALMILGIAPTKNDPYAMDDDGFDQAQQHTLETLKKPKNLLELDPTVPTREEGSVRPSGTINDHQYKELLIELNNYPEIAENILHAYKIETLADLPASKYIHARSEIMRLREAYKQDIRRK